MTETVSLFDVADFVAFGLTMIRLWGLPERERKVLVTNAWNRITSLVSSCANKPEWLMLLGLACMVQAVPGLCFFWVVAFWGEKDEGAE